MSATWIRHANAEIPMAPPVYRSEPVSLAGPPSDMSPFALKIAALTLALGILFLASLGAWLWYAAYQYQNIG